MTMKKCNEIALLDRFLYEGTNTECIIVDIKTEEDEELYDCYTYAYLNVIMNDFSKITVSKSELLRNYTRYQHYETIT